VSGSITNIRRREGMHDKVLSDGVTLRAGTWYVPVCCHATWHLHSPIAREGIWETDTASCSIRALLQYVDSVLDGRTVSPEWEIYWTEPRNADASVNHEGDIHGPVRSGELYALKGNLVKLHLYPLEKSRGDYVREVAAKKAALEARLKQAEESRRREREWTLKFMLPEDRRNMLAAESEAKRRRDRHVEFLKSVKEQQAAQERAKKAKKQAHSAPLTVSMTHVDYGFVPLIEQVSGDTYYWCPATGEITWDEERARAGGDVALKNKKELLSHDDAQEYVGSVQEHRVRSAFDELQRAAGDENCGESDMENALRKFEDAKSVSESIHRTRRASAKGRA
jgi:hypothetical protein